MKQYKYLIFSMYLMLPFFTLSMDQSLNEAIDKLDNQEVNQLLKNGTSITNTDSVENNCIFQLLIRVPYHHKHVEILESLLSHTKGRCLINKKCKLDGQEMSNLALLVKGLHLGGADNDMKSVATMIYALLKRGEDPYENNVIKLVTNHGLVDLADYMTKKRSEYQNSGVYRSSTIHYSHEEQEREINSLSQALKNHYSSLKSTKKTKKSTSKKSACFVQ